MLSTLVGCGTPMVEPFDAGLQGEADASVEGFDAGCLAAATSGPGFVKTQFGTVQGREAGATWAYQGVPFAAPPTGELRWRAPAEPACWSDVRQTTAFPPKCLQSGVDGGVSGSEDCLYLNVWAPKTTPTGGLPVMVYVHGGGNMTGSTSDVAQGASVGTYEGQALAERGEVVVVTVQYRLNALGFLVHPALDADGPSGTSGNYGLMDQLASLKWVQANIAAFGGDPTRVALFGESGGATDVCALYASPRAAGLFSSAIMQSGSCNAREKATMQQWSADIVSRTPCATAAEPLSCLRSLDGAAIASAVIVTGAQGRETFAGPTIDGDVLTESPLASISRGAHNQVPFMVGTTASETSSQLFGLPAMLSPTEYEQRVRMMFGPTIATQVLQRYPAANFPTGRAALVAVTTDLQFTCPARTVARAAAANQSKPVYRYFFTQVLRGGSPFLTALGASHGLELYFVFQHTTQLGNYVPTSSDLAVEGAMRSGWTSMAAVNDPNGVGAPFSWPRYQSVTDPYLDFGTPVTARQGVRTAECDFWDSLSP